MSDIIDFNAEKINRDTDADQKLIMPDGSKWYKYTVNYDFDCKEGGGLPDHLVMMHGEPVTEKKTYSVDFWAQNDGEAKARVEAMRKAFSEPVRVLSKGQL